MTTAECVATPAEELERQIMSPLVSKSEREHWAAREIERLRRELSKKLEPDYFYNAEDWEVTTEWCDRYEIDCDDLDVGHWREYATLVDGPPRFAARVPIAGDDEGELRWFETKQEAIDVLPPQKS